MFRRIRGARNGCVSAIIGVGIEPGRFSGSCTARRVLSYDSTVYSELVLDHFRSPRNAGKLPNATAQVQAANPVCGDVLELAARVDDGRIVEARFLCRGCTTAIACASLLTERLTGATIAAARAMTAEEISSALGELPPATFHAAQLAVEALQSLLAKLNSAK